MKGHAFLLLVQGRGSGLQFGREWTKFAVRFREVSALERVPLQRYKCNSAGSGPNLLSGLERCPV